MLKPDPIWLPEAQQRHFRQLLDAMARPGTCHAIDTRPEAGPVVLSVLASLLDAEVSLADPHELLCSEDWPKLQATNMDAEQADYVLCDGTGVPDFTPKLGSLPEPEQSATLILLVEQLGRGQHHLKLTGPGIEQTTTLHIDGLATEWLQRREEWVSGFPLGVDLILVDEYRLAALPRTTRVEVD